MHPIIGILAISIFWYVVGYIIGQSEWVKGPIKRWCVMDGENPEDNQTIVEARTAEEAMAKGAAEVFGLVVEEAQ